MAIKISGTTIITDETNYIELAGTNALKVPSGNTAQQPSGVAGMFRFNTTDSSFEGYNGTAWGAIGGGLFTETSSGVWETTAITSLEIDGDLIVTGDATSLSDERYKEDIVPVSNALDIVGSINGVYYTLTQAPEKRRVGVLAQNVEEVLPEVVSETDGVKSVAYGNIVGVLVEAIKELRKEIRELKDGIQ